MKHTGSPGLNAAAQLDLYRDHPGEKDTGTRWYEESIGIYGAERNRHEAEYNAEGTAAEGAVSVLSG